MGMLRNQRQELFCRKIVQGAKDGMTQRRAYVESGYKSQGDAIDINASRLIRSEKVKQRMDELARPAIRKARVSVESLLSELDVTIRDAREAKQHAVVVNALTLSAKLVGLLRDRLEVGGVGEFSACESLEDVANQLVDGSIVDARATLEGLDALRRVIEDRIAAAALDVTPDPVQG